MNASQNVQILKQWYAGKLKDAYTEDIEWEHPGPEDIPWSGTYRGIEGVKAFFARVRQSGIEQEAFKPLHFIAQDNRVVVLGHERNRVKATGSQYEVEWAHVWTLREDQIAGLKEYTDTAAIAEALRES